MGTHIPTDGDEFTRSWDNIESFYHQLIKDGTHSVRRVLDLIAQMREAGYDRKFRAGQAMFTLVLSRSRQHGLRREQPRICIDVYDRGMTVSARVGEEIRFVTEQVTLDAQLEKVLKRLEAQPID